MVNIKGFNIIIVASMLIAASIFTACGDNPKYPDGNRNTAFSFAAYGSGYIFYNPDGSRILKRDGSEGDAEVVFDINTQKDDNIDIVNVSALTVYKDYVFFIYEVPSIYKNNIRVGKINIDKSDITLNLTENTVIKNREQESTGVFISPHSCCIREAGGKIIISGDGYYSSSFMISHDFSEAFELMSHIYYGSSRSLVYGQRGSNIVAFPHEFVIGEEPDSVKSPETISFFDDHIGYYIMGVQSITVSDEGALYYTLDNISLFEEIPNIIYVRESAEESSRPLYEHTETVYNVLWYDGILYFSDSKSVYKFDEQRSESVYLSSYAEYKYNNPNVSKARNVSFTILGGKLYTNLNDFSDWQELQK